jgi:hypothetical protein
MPRIYGGRRRRVRGGHPATAQSLVEEVALLAVVSTSSTDYLVWLRRSLCDRLETTVS